MARSHGRHLLQAPWSDSARSVLASFETTPDGLSRSEVLRRQKRYGKNKIRRPGRFTALTLFVKQFRSPLIIALIAAVIISVAISLVTNDQKWVEAIVISLAVIANTALGFWQEHKAQTSLELLDSYTRIRARVRRNSQSEPIDARELVPGDIIELKQGDRVPADARLITVNNVRVNESPLTGESLAVSKQKERIDQSAQLGDRSCMVFNGTDVVEGSAVAVVTAIGRATEFGQIAELLADTKRQKTPLQRSIESFSTKAGIWLFGIGVVLFLLGYGVGGKSLEMMFFIALAAIVSAVPEGLPVAVTVVLSIGVERLAKRKGVVRRLLAAETLGSTTTILTDKTGTLTKAQMSLDHVVTAPDIAEEDVLAYAVTNTNVDIDNPEAGVDEWVLHGEPIEQALVTAAGRRGYKPQPRTKDSDAFERLPFSADRKYSATITKISGGYRIDVLGAPEIIIEKTMLDKEERVSYTHRVSREARDGARVIALASAYVDHYDGDIRDAIAQASFTFQGLLSFRDPIRLSVKDAINRIGSAGVRTVIVTGDHKGTATYVARELGIATSENDIYDGDSVAGMSDQELVDAVGSARVFARVTPAQKVRILQAFQSRGDVTAVTGDGVNDAPALKTADIGVAMGSGTDVAKSTADLIILDDNYETIVAAIEEGRKIVQNLRKVIIFLLSDSFDELILIGGAILANIGLPLTAIQILFVKVFNDTLPSLSFPFDKGGAVFDRNPDTVQKKLFNKDTKVLTVGRGLLSAVLLFVLYYGLLTFTLIDPALVRTFAFASFSAYILFLVFPLRSIEQNIWEFNPFSNWYMNASVIVGLGMTAYAIYLPPLRSVLGLTWMPLSWLWGVLAFCVVNVFVMEVLKWWLKKHR